MITVLLRNLAVLGVVVFLFAVVPDPAWDVPWWHQALIGFGIGTTALVIVRVAFPEDNR